MSTHEQWRPVVGYAGYEVSDLGQVRSLDRKVKHGARTMSVAGRVRKVQLDHDGYQKVSLSREGHRPKLVFVHHLVLEAFVGPRPVGQECCHGPGGRTDNRLTNLRWDTKSENMKDVVRHGGVPWRARLVRECPRGHLLRDPNLFESDKRAGRRGCRSCQCTHRVRDGLSWQEFLDKADAKYSELTGLEPNYDAPGRLKAVA